MQGTNPSRELTNKKTDKPSREPTLTRERNQGNQPYKGTEPREPTLHTREPRNHPPMQFRGRHPSKDFVDLFVAAGLLFKFFLSSSTKKKDKEVCNRVQ